MPREFDNSDVKVVDSTSVDEEEDFDDPVGSDDDSSSSSPDSKDTKTVQLTDVVGEDGFRKTEDQLQEDVASGNTENLSQAPNTEEANTVTEDLVTTTEQEKQADVNLSGLQDSQGKQLTEQEALRELQENPGDVEPGAGLRSSKSAILESRRNRRDNILQERRDELSQKSKLPGIDRDNIVVGSRQDPLNNAARDFFNPNRQVSENLNTAGEAVLAGQDIIRNSEEFGENVDEQLPDQLDFFGSGVGGPVAGAELAGRGQIIEGVQTAVIPGNQNQLEEKRSRQAREGLFAGPGTLVGFGVGGAGAVAKAGEQELKKIQGEETEGPGFGGSLAGGAATIGNQVSKNPGRFAANEIGEEIGEGIATAGLGLAIPTITPDITPTVRAQTPDSVQTTGRFITGDLGTRARDPDTRINLEDTEVLQREFVDNPDGDGRAQVVEGFRFTEGGTQVSTGGGVRLETPVSRREFLAERTGLRDAELADLLPTSSRRGTTSGIPLIRESSPETTPDSTPETDSSPDLSPEDLFRETPRQDSKPLPDEFSVSSGRLNAVLEQGLDQDQGLGQDIGLDQSSINEEDIGQEIETPFDNSVESRGRIDQTLDQDQEEIFLDPRIARGSNSNSLSANSFGFENEQTNGEELDLFGSEQDREIRRSVGADLLGLEDQDLTREDASNPLSLRGGVFNQ